jgi:RimJ/RimL family protein N-acetyltransferase
MIEQSRGDGVKAVFVAEAAGELLGMAGIAGTAAEKQAHRADIWGVYVRPAARGRGVATGMVAAAIDWARARGLVMVTLAVIVGNETARRCYERAGFTVYGVQPMVIRVDGEFYDELLMVKRL